MRHTLLIFAALLGFAVGARAATIELAYVSETIATDGAIIVMEDGQSYRIVKSSGCLALTTYEGRFVLVYSPDGFLREDYSEIILLGEDQRCEIVAVRPLGYFTNDVSVRSARMRGFTEREMRTLCEAALKELGYEIVVVDGETNDELKSAITTFQKNHRIDPSGELGPVTKMVLAGQIHRIYADEPGTLAVGSMILRAASTELRCRKDRQIEAIADAGGTIQIDGGDTFRIREADREMVSAWTKEDYVRVCSHIVYNIDAGEVAALEKSP